MFVSKWLYVIPKYHTILYQSYDAWWVSLYYGVKQWYTVYFAVQISTTKMKVYYRDTHLQLLFPAYPCFLPSQKTLVETAFPMYHTPQIKLASIGPNKLIITLAYRLILRSPQYKSQQMNQEKPGDMLHGSISNPSSPIRWCDFSRQRCCALKNCKMIVTARQVVKARTSRNHTWNDNLWNNTAFTGLVWLIWPLMLIFDELKACMCIYIYIS